MGAPRSDISQRLLGLGMFLPILIPVLLGPPAAFWGLALISLWISAEYSHLLTADREISVTRQAAFASVLWACFLLLSFSSLPFSVQSGLVFGLGLLGLALNRRQAGFTILVIGCLCALAVLGRTETGVLIVLFSAVVIAAGDSGAYFVGRWLGGPKLAPAISPSKTWSGSMGGLFLSLLGGGCFLLITGAEINAGNMMKILLWLVIISILAQAGDLIESWTKRRLQVKDSSRLIPGHGGVLDRFDGYLLALPVIASAEAAGLFISVSSAGGGS